MYDATLNILGLMSGTSLDGMDAALVQFSEENGLQWQLLENFEFGYPEALKILVNNCFKDASLQAEVDQAFAHWTISCIEHIKEKPTSKFTLLVLMDRPFFTTHKKIHLSSRMLG